jgi:hypothetical protein
MNDRTEPELASVPGQLPNGRALQHSARASSAPAKQSTAHAPRLLRWGMPSPAPLRRHDEALVTRDDAELAQRGRLILDVSSAGLETAEAAFGAFHPTTWHFRDYVNEARRFWERLRALLGTKTLEAALSQPPLATLSVGDPVSGSPRVVLVLIEGTTYRAQQVPGTELAPIQWRLTRLHPPLENGPYYVCRLAGGSTQCDCAEWTYRIAETDASRQKYCKHLAALVSLGWI